jgi:hypothetical protein
MLARGEEPTAGAVRTLMPVNVRKRGDEGVLDNCIVAMVLLLPVEIDDPARRLSAVHERIGVLRSVHEIEAAAAVVELADNEPFAAVSRAIRAALWLPQRAVVTVTTNVPGPRVRLHVLGRPILGILPYVPIAERMRIGVAVLTYAGEAASTCGGSGPTGSGGWSATCPRTRISSTPPSGRTCASAAATPPTQSCVRRWRRPGWRTGSTGCRAGSTRWWGSTACRSPAASAAGWRLPARCSPTSPC